MTGYRTPRGIEYRPLVAYPFLRTCPYPAFFLRLKTRGRGRFKHHHLTIETLSRRGWIRHYARKRRAARGF